MRPRTLLLAVPLLAALLLPAPPAVGGEGLQSSADLRRVPGSTEPDARGGYTAFFRARNDGGTTQGIRVWATGLSDATEASVWMAKPGDAETEEVASLAGSENGSGVWEVIVDSSFSGGDGLPLGAGSVLELFGGVIEIRVSGVDFDEPVLRAKVSPFRWRELRTGPRGRVSALRRAPEFEDVVDEFASGTARLWRKRRGGEVRHGLAVFAKGLTPDDFYEIWIEDASGALVMAGEADSTSEGLAYFALGTGDGETFPPEIDADTIRDLSRRRVEVRRSGFDGYSLAGLFPRVR
jgi:hypothetical protein